MCKNIKTNALFPNFHIKLFSLNAITGHFLSNKLVKEMKSVTGYSGYSTVVLEMLMDDCYFTIQNK